MKILVISDLLPYAGATHAGGTTIFNYIRTLAEMGHEVSLLSYTNEEEQRQLADLGRYCRHIASVPRDRPFIRKLFRLPLLALYSRESWRTVHDPRFSRKLKEVLKLVQPDLVQIEQPWMFFYKKYIRDFPTVLDEHDVFFQILLRKALQEPNPLKRAVLRAECLKMARTEIQYLKQADLVLTRSEKDRSFLYTLLPQIRVEILDPWISFGKMLDISADAPPPGKKILFFGDMRREVNIEAARHFCRDIFPRVKEKVPQAVFVIAGVDPPADIVALGDGRHVVVTGYVENMTEIYRECRVFAAPLLLGGGIIVKILDAMAAGRPVVTTRIGNEGIRAEHGKQVWIASSANSFADGVIRLLQDDDRWMETARNAREFCTTKFQWDAMVRSLVERFSELIAAPGA